jgi:hypothetical protein
VPFTTQGSGTAVGTLRFGDRDYAMTFPSAYGQRATFTRSFDFTDSFNITFNLNDMTQDHTALLMISTSKQDPYIDGNGAYLSMDLVRHPTDPNNYCLTLTTSTHNTSITGTEWPTTAWSGNSAYTGLELTGVTDNELTIEFSNLSETNAVVTVNGTSYTVPSATLFASFPSGSDMTQIYVALGVMNGNSSLLDHVVISDVGDADDEVYYGATGDYTVQKGYIDQLAEAVAAGLETIEKLNAAKAIKANIDLTKLYDYDQNYVQASYDASVAALDAATLALGNDAVIADYKDAVDALKTAIALDLTVEANVDSAIAKADEAAAKKEAVAALTDLTTDQTSTIATIDADYDTAYATLKTAAAKLYTDSVDAFAASTDDLSDTDKIAAALLLRSGILNKYSSYLSEEDQATYGDKVSAANALLAAKQTAPDGWSLGNRGYYAADGDALGYVSSGSLWGDSQLDTTNTNAIIYTKEMLSSSDFSITFDIKKWSTVDGAWLSFGLMEHPGYFSTAEDDSVQNNKGIFFLLRANVGQSEINVDGYITTLTSNRFFDAEMPTKMDIPFSDTLTVTFNEVEETISGVTETYWVPTFNGQAMDTDHIKATRIKTSLANKEGYLYIGTNDASDVDPFVIDVTDINGHKPSDASLIKSGDDTTTSSSVPDTSSETPTTSDGGETTASGGCGGGCGGAIGGTVALAVVAIAGVAALAIKRRKES